MSYKGTVKRDGILLDEPLPFAEGTRVEVAVTPEQEPRRGSPQALLKLGGLLTEGEAETILRGAQECRRIDWPLWRLEP